MNINTIAIQPKHQHLSIQQNCDFCNAEDDKICPIGGYVVQLESLYMAGVKKIACQSCLHEQFELMMDD